MSIRMRQTRGKTRQRRSHHKLDEPQLATCANCSAEHIRHTACMNCGMYRGRQVIDMQAVAAKKERKRQRKQEELEAQGLGGESAGQTQSQGQGELNAENLSHTDNR